MVENNMEVNDMRRIMLTYPDGKLNYCWFDDDDGQARFEIGGVSYTANDIKSTGATIAVNHPETMHRLHELGLQARPTPMQFKFTISVSHDTHDRLKAASKAEKKPISRIIESLIVEWLDKNGY